MSDIDCQFRPDGDGFLPTEGAVGPWSADLLQGSAYGSLLVRALERHGAPDGMMLGRLGYDLWRPVTRERITLGRTLNVQSVRLARGLRASPRIWTFLSALVGARAEDR